MSGGYGERFLRQEALLGSGSAERLAEKSVLLCGLGGVGGYVLEALVRVGIGRFVLVDGDVFEPSNLNRQILCTTALIGKDKVAAGAARIREVNPEASAEALKLFLDKDNIPSLLKEKNVDYIIDAIDNITAKVALAKAAEELSVPIIASMGTGNKLDPSGFICADIYETSVCPLAKIMRKLLRENGVRALKVVYSKEPPISSGVEVGSVSFVPPAAAEVIAGEVVKDLLGLDERRQAGGKR